MSRLTSSKSIASILLFYVLIPLVITEQLQIGPLRATLLVKLTELTIFVLVLWGSLSHRNWLKFPSGLSWVLMLCFVNALVLSSAFSDLPRSSLSITVIYLNGLFIFLLICNLIEDWKTFYRLVWVFSVLLIISVVVRLLWTIFPGFGVFFSQTFFPDFIQANLGYQVSRKTLPLFDASHLLFLVPLSLIFSPNIKKKLIPKALYIISLVSVTMSVSRSYFISSVFGILSLFLYGQLFLSKKYNKLVVSVVLLSVVAVGLGLTISTIFFNQSVLDRLTWTFNYDLDNLGNRPVWINHSIWLFKNKPFLGVGPGMFGYFSQNNRPQLWNQDFLRYLQRSNQSTELAVPSGHNPLTLLSEAGVIGFGLQVMIYLFYIISDFRYLKTKSVSSRNKFIYLLFSIPSTFLLIIISLFDNLSPPEIYFFYIARGILASPVFNKSK